MYEGSAENSLASALVLEPGWNDEDLNRLLSRRRRELRRATSFPELENEMERMLHHHHASVTIPFGFS
jgi:hypothetical protein